MAAPAGVEFNNERKEPEKLLVIFVVYFLFCWRWDFLLNERNGRVFHLVDFVDLEEQIPEN